MALGCRTGAVAIEGSASDSEGVRFKKSTVSFDKFLFETLYINAGRVPALSLVVSDLLFL